ncbi:N-acetylmuramoyl-L-alanine amidase [Anaerosinus gibii]|uniref:N-acetylmuramoyl-L-alanine amidase n=1 Tax=Selenobaculum gibii TaxID=3054208 RepID=A0A9Y2AIW8_9FIRM|nr:N-acetylmuramoyl-L-alanine amidase [Selenobaculum gbiensis]WIW70626.1 N-acetylmuramoyl-L-alanine amidase [Selenobaculum gbiensis]
MRDVKIKDFGLNFKSLTDRTKTNLIVIHHTGDGVDRDYHATDIHKMHLNQGWSGCGYHYVISKDGTIEVGRPHWCVGAHDDQTNSRSIGIHVSGDFDVGNPTPEQIESTALLLAKLCMEYGLDITEKFVVGHRDTNCTACPGDNLYALLQTIRGKAIWYQNN